MKKNILLIISLLITQATHSKLLVTPAFQHPIHQKDASTTTANAFEIKSSGRYYLASDFIIGSTVSGANLIKISAGNVTLDLNTKTISPRVTSDQTDLVGIKVANNKSNIAIMNGNIVGSDAGGTQRLELGINLGESGGRSISLIDININQCQENAIYGKLINDVDITNCSINNNNFNTGPYPAGILLWTCNNINILNCEINNNISSYSDEFSALWLYDCNSGKINNTSINSNDSSTHDSTGIYFEDSSNFIVTNCTVSNTTTTAGSNHYASGIYVNTNSNLNSFENCHANGTTASNTAATFAQGLYVHGNSCSFKDCSFSRSTTAGTGIAYGIRIRENATSNTFVNCIMNNNSKSDSGIGNTAGVYITDATASNNKFINCQANNNSSAGGSTYGFDINGTNCLFENCQAIANSNSNATKLSVGFKVSGNDNRLNLCNSNQNVMSAAATTAGTDGFAAGYYFDSSAARNQLTDCNATGNQASASDAETRAYGIYITGTASNNIVKKCYLAYNTVVHSNAKSFGFYDNSGSDNATMTTLLINNTSAGHGKCLEGSLGASLVWNINDEPTSSQNFFFKHAGTGDDPRYLIHEVSLENVTSLSTSVKEWQNISIYTARENIA